MQAGVTSSGINNIWMSRWLDAEGAAVHAEKPLLAYRAAEALRLQDWGLYAHLTADYRRLRAHLCRDYLAGQDELVALCQELRAEFFPLGAGTGTCLVVAEAETAIAQLAEQFLRQRRPRERPYVAPFAIREHGVEFFGFGENGLLLPGPPEPC